MTFMMFPFHAEDIQELQRMIKEDEVSFEKKRKVSSDLCDLIYQMLIKDPKNRIKLVEIKKHPFMINPIKK